ncbi:MAG: hypothetical protein ABI432_18515, partial [Flavobacteriales bacterium]
MQLRYSLMAATSLLASTLLAQPTIDASNNIPLYSAGQEFSVRQSSWFDEGPAGANVTYQFWNLISTSNKQYRFYDANITPTHTLIPSATFLSTDGGSDSLFYTVTANGLEQVGSATSLEGKVNFTDALLELKYPCTYGTTWSDPTSASYTVGGFPVTRTGTITGNADGYGVLNVSEVSYPSVLRVHTRKATTDASIVATINRVSHVWNFYTETTPYPVLKLMLDTVIVNGGAPSVVKSSQWIGGPGGVGMQDISFDEAQFNAYPNPASDVVTVSI